jgi:hypothetical protein
VSEYTPDGWVVVEIKDANKTVFRILASWYGGFAGVDSWKLGSSIEHVVKHEDFFEFKNSSGSTYFCQNASYRMSMLARSIYNTLCADAAKFNGSIRILEISEIETLNGKLR